MAMHLVQYHLKTSDFHPVLMWLVASYHFIHICFTMVVMVLLAGVLLVTSQIYQALALALRVLGVQK